MSRFLQLVLAIVGIVLTFVLQFASNENAKQQTKQAYTQQFIQTLAYSADGCSSTMIGLAADAAARLEEMHEPNAQIYLDGLGEVTASCEARAQTQADAGILAAPPPPAAETRFEAQQPERADLARSRSRSETAQQAAVGAASQSLDFRREQNTGRVPTTNEFYAVLASYAVGDNATYDAALGAAAHFRQLLADTQGQGVQVQLFRTRISNHFAIVLAPEGLTREGARDLVTRARSAGWASDAFVQEKRNWVQCPNPGDNAALRSCAGSR